jgi:hypothetical protein
MLLSCPCCRVSGVTDHYAVSDEHALSIARSIVANLNWTEGTKTFVSPALCSCVLVRLYVLWILATVRFGGNLLDSSLPA